MYLILTNGIKLSKVWSAKQSSKGKERNKRTQTGHQGHRKQIIWISSIKRKPFEDSKQNDTLWTYKNKVTEYNSQCNFCKLGTMMKKCSEIVCVCAHTCIHPTSKPEARMRWWVLVARVLRSSLDFSNWKPCRYHVVDDASDNNP